MHMYIYIIYILYTISIYYTNYLIMFYFRTYCLVLTGFSLLCDSSKVNKWKQEFVINNLNKEKEVSD